MNILLTENSPGCGLQMKTELEARGHSVTWIIGVAELEGNRIFGILPSPTPVNQLFGEESDADLNRVIELDLTKIDFAYCDARMLGKITGGDRLVQVLVANGIVCCACSTAGNRRLLEVGAEMGIAKLFWVLALKAGLLDPEKLMADAARAARELSAFEEQKQTELSDARKGSQRFKTGFAVFDNLQ